MRVLFLSALVLTVACAGDSPADDAGSGVPSSDGFQPPVATNPSPPFAYPPALYADGVEGTVILRLWIDADGQIAADSTTIAEGSGFPELDSAALLGAADLRFAPALQDGVPVSTIFLQPVQFRQPDDAP